MKVPETRRLRWEYHSKHPIRMNRRQNRRTRRLAGALALLVAMGATPAWTQLETGEIRLLVEDPSGLPLPASSGVLISDASNTRRPFETDALGRFTFTHLPFGVYRITVSHAGFQPLSTLVSVRSALPRDCSLRLSIQPVSAEVDVTGHPTLLDGHSTMLSYSAGPQQIQEEQSPIPARGVLDLVNLQPGWLFEANGVLHPRGSEDQTLFVVDGTPMDENRSPAFAPEFDIDNVQSMNIMTGGFPAEYGRKLGGVVEITTDKDRRHGLHGSADVDGGSFDTLASSLAGSYGWTRSMLSLNLFGARTDRYLDPPVPDNFTNSATLDGVTAAYDQDLSDFDRIYFSVERKQTRFEVPNENLQQAAGQRQDRNSMEDLGQVSWTHLFSPRLLLALHASEEDLSANLWSNPLSTPMIAGQQRGFRRAYASADLSASRRHHELKFGADAYYAPVTEALQYQITNPDFFDEGTPMAFRFMDRKIDREPSAFAQDTIRYGNLTVSLGLRYDYYSMVVKTGAWSPRTGIAWYWPRANLVLRFSYDRVFITPAIENLLLASSPQVDSVDPDVLRIPVQPSRGNYYEAGFSKAILGAMRLDASYYVRTFTNYADDDLFLNTGISFPIAFDSARIRGVDVKLDLPRWRGISGFVSYSNMLGIAQLPVAGGLFLGDDAAGAIGATGSFPISQDQRNTARSGVRYQLRPRIWISASAEYGSGLPSEADVTDLSSLIAEYGQRVVDRLNASAGRVRPNFSLDASLGADVWKRETRAVVFEITSENLTNRLDVINFAGLFSGTAISPPRSVNARLRYDF
jgi:outer membrane cobalamin receptor